MQCSECGSQINEGSLFCNNCGKLMNNIQVQEPSPQNTLIDNYDKRTTVAETNYIKGLLLGISSALSRSAIVILLAALLSIFVPSLTFLTIPIIAFILLLRPLVGVFKFREGRCPNCGYYVDGIIKDDVIICKKCNKRIIVDGNQFVSM